MHVICCHVLKGVVLLSLCRHASSLTCFDILWISDIMPSQICIQMQRPVTPPKVHLLILACQTFFKQQVIKFHAAVYCFVIFTLTALLVGVNLLWIYVSIYCIFQELVNQFSRDDVPASLRLPLIHCVALPPRWIIEVWSSNLSVLCLFNTSFI